MGTFFARPAWFALALGALVLAPHTAAASSDEATPTLADEQRLEAGEVVSYPQTLTRHGQRYIGGVTYVVVDASVEELTAVLADPSAYLKVLPHARDARFLGDEDGDRFVQITQGISLVQAAYTLRMRTDQDNRRVRFWLDRSKPHDIDDAWGFFRVEKLHDAADGSPRVLVAYGMLVDLGPGLLRDFFEERVQASLLSVPWRLREYAWIRFRGRHRA